MENHNTQIHHQQDLMDFEDKIRKEIAVALIKENVSVERVARCTRVPIKWVMGADQEEFSKIMRQAAYEEGREEGWEIGFKEGIEEALREVAN